MAGLWNLLPLYLDGGNDGLNLSDFLNAVTDHQSLAVNDDVDSPAQLQVVATVNAMLNKPESRYWGPRIRRLHDQLRLLGTADVADAARTAPI